MKEFKVQFEDGDGATVKTRLNEYAQLINIRNDWIPDAREVSDWLIPARGIFTANTRPKKRTLVSSKIVNPKGKQAFEVLVSALKEGITPSSRPWIDFKFANRALRQIRPLNIWLSEAKEEMYSQLRRANFYQTITNFYKESCAFGTASCGVNPGPKDTALHFHVPTFGEFAVGTNDFNIVDRYYRTIYMNFWQLYKKFGDRLPIEMLEKLQQRDATLDFWYTVVEGVVPERFMDMPFTRFYILQCESKSQYDGGIKSKIDPDNKYREFLGVEGCNEFPWPTVRFDVVSSDEYGIGPGMEAVQTIKRLQEVVKSGSIAYHKSIRPPLNVPVHMKGQVRTYPDALNYYVDPQQIITPAYDTRFDHASAAQQEMSLDKILQEVFFNDVFLTASRNPNASPLKARQVDQIDSEKFIRLGPTLERFFYEGIMPIGIRSFNICSRAGKLPPLPEEYANENLTLEVELTSLLAQMMKSMAAIPVQDFLQLVGGVAQYRQEVMDIPDFDSIVYDYANIKGVNPAHMFSRGQVKSAREQRAQTMQAQQQKAEQAQMAVMQEEANANRASAAKDMSEAGLNLTETLPMEGQLL